MSILIIIGDGMADEPIPELNNRTPLQVAQTPYMDYLASHGWNGLLTTVPLGWEVGSDVACLSILGYDIPTVYQGRSAFEAASLGIPIQENEMVMRCNFISIENNQIQSFTADHISTEEAQQLIAMLNEHLSTPELRFFAGNTYRHLLRLAHQTKAIECLSPHNAIHLSKDHLLIKALTPQAQETADLLNQLILKSQELLANHPINLTRIRQGKLPANSISLWAPGYTPSMKHLDQLFPIKKGAIISATDLIKGIGYYAGLEVIEVAGATGRHDTNYQGKAQATIQALQNNDFVFLHIEASDEASHDGDYKLKIKTIEDLDEKIIQPILRETNQWSNAPLIALLPDHPTSSLSKVHLREPVPFTIYHAGSGRECDQVFEERFTPQGDILLYQGGDLIRYLFEKQRLLDSSRNK